MKFLTFCILLVVAYVAADPVPDPQLITTRYSTGLPVVYSVPSYPSYTRVVSSPYAYSRSGLYYGGARYYGDGLGSRVYTI